MLRIAAMIFGSGTVLAGLAIVLLAGGVVASVVAVGKAPLCFVFGCGPGTPPNAITRLPPPTAIAGTPAQIALAERASAGQLPAALLMAVLDAGLVHLSRAQIEYLWPTPCPKRARACTPPPPTPTTTEFAEARYLAGLGIDAHPTSVIVQLMCGSESNACHRADQVAAVGILRNAAVLAGLTPPSVALPGVPQPIGPPDIVPGPSRIAFFTSVLDTGHWPVSTASLQALTAAAVGEGAFAWWNPMDTTLPEAGAVAYNSFGPNGAYHVWSYPSEAVGISATVSTIAGWPSVVAALSSSAPASVIVTALDADVGDGTGFSLYAEALPSVVATWPAEGLITVAAKP
jgi:hypothetical protein